MRKYLRNITVGAALLLLAGSCTDKFEEYNTNQYQIHDADPATLMKSMIETIVNIQQNDSQMQDQMVGQLGGYLCCSNTWSGTNFSTFNQREGVFCAEQACPHLFILYNVGRARLRRHPEERFLGDREAVRQICEKFAQTGRRRAPDKKPTLSSK